MATASIPFIFVNGVNSVADDVNSNFDALVDFLNDHSIRAGGEGSLTSNLPMSGFKVTNLANATVDGEIVNIVTGIIKAFLNAKGDIVIATGDDTPVIIPVGSNFQVLEADSGVANGLKWAFPPKGQTADVQIFTANGTWNKPSSPAPKIVEAFLFGAGGGGSGGISGGQGGGGGGGGGLTQIIYLASELGSSEAVNIGVGGLGNGPVSQPPTAGGNTTFYKATGWGAKPGPAGSPTNGGHGGGAVNQYILTEASSPYTFGSTFGHLGASQGSSAEFGGGGGGGGSSQYAAGGGGQGQSATAGGSGRNQGVRTTGGGGAGGNPPTAGGPFQGGGGSSLSNGGNGGAPGGGGGGAQNATGGNGARGEAWIVSYF